jgi:hypothetical protein
VRVGNERCRECGYLPQSQCNPPSAHISCVLALHQWGTRDDDMEEEEEILECGVLGVHKEPSSALGEVDRGRIDVRMDFSWLYRAHLLHCECMLAMLNKVRNGRRE